jgi:hypothetical protein
LANETAKLHAPTILFHEQDHYTIAHWRDVAFVHWLARADAPAMERVHGVLRQVVSEHPRGVSFIHVAHEGVGLPDAGARQALTQMMAEFAEVTVCVGVVLRGNGFWASAMQSVLTGLRLLAPPRRWQMRFANHQSEIAGWVAKAHEQRTQRALDPGELETVLEHVLAPR